MKKLFYVPAVIFALHSIASALAAGYFLLQGMRGDAALYLIFTFSGMVAGTIMFTLAQD